MTAMKQPLGTLLVVSGPSGSGKTTLCRRATENGLCVYSISCTTRQPRPGEVNGVDYHFLTPAEFDARVERGDFLEYAEVHGNRYGTLKADILTLLEQGKNVVMDIDVQGAGQVRSCREGILPLCYADVYIYVPQAELKNRLCGRQTDGVETIALRLRNAEQEDACLPQYQHFGMRRCVFHFSHAVAGPRDDASLMHKDRPHGNFPAVGRRAGFC